MRDYYQKGMVISVWSVVISFTLLLILNQIDDSLVINEFILGYLIGYFILFVQDSIFNLVDKILRDEFTFSEIVLPLFVFVIYVVTYCLLSAKNALPNNLYFIISSFFFSAFSYRYLITYKHKPFFSRGLTL
jgi:hypothetical protein